ncbi:MAG TPA: MBL fold metallo-hydrolase [Candidatus Dormibacteraeota bacterium]|nr:MBL fold metallo-hydrolase [Candidatus Dormibacteraeota bacterium]
MAQSGAPRDGDRFVNGAGARPLAGSGEMFQFFLRKIWSSVAGRSGAAARVPFDPEAIRHNPSITWIGHATFLVRMDGVTFLTDPMFSERASPVSFAGPARLVEPGVPLDELPPLDFALVSHDHYDHLDLPTIAALARRGVPIFTPLGMGDLIREAGGTATELDWWQERAAGRVRIHCVPAQHFSGRTLSDGNQRLWAGWVVEGPTRRFFHSGDTGYFDGFAEIAKRIGPPDLAALPIGAYDPASIMRFVHMNPEEAMQAAVDLHAGIAVGMHYGTFDLTEEPLDEPPRRFHAAASQHALDGVVAWTMKIGETRTW